jgi:hypothetical protein
MPTPCPQQGSRQPAVSPGVDEVFVENVRRAVFDAEDEYRRALQVVPDADAVKHRDEILAKWLRNLWQGHRCT